MKDIRADIKERLDALGNEFERISSRLVEVGQLRDQWLSLLAEEDSRWPSQLPFAASPSVNRNGHTPKMRSPLGMYLLQTLDDEQVWTLDALTEAVLQKGLLEGKKHPRRVVHFSLVGMKQNGMVDMPESGHWRKGQ